MKKNTDLVNIYLKIHNKQPLTMEDLRYLAWYAPECFEKTCKNVVYNMPESKPVMVPEEAKAQPPTLDPEPPDTERIEQVLDNLKNLETDEQLFTSLQANTVKSLLGNLYMEMLFPHNGNSTFISANDDDSFSRFDKKI